MKKVGLFLLLMGLFLITIPVVANGFLSFNEVTTLQLTFNEVEIKTNVQEVMPEKLFSINETEFFIGIQTPVDFQDYIIVNNSVLITADTNKIKANTIMSEKRGGFLHFARLSKPYLIL